MLLQTIAFDETVMTETTLEWPFACMSPQVNNQRATAGEPMVTSFADVGTVT